MSTTKSAIDQLARYIKAKYPVIVLNSHEEGRVMKAIEKMANDLDRKVAVWSYTSGLEGLEGVEPGNYEDPNAVLEYIASNVEPNARTIFVLKDAHNIIGQDVRAVRYVRDIANAFDRWYHESFFDFIAGKQEIADELVNLHSASEKIVNKMWSDLFEA
jgi:hypothetical protein